MTTPAFSFDEFKQLAKEFHEAAPTLNEDELDNAWKCLGLAYLEMNEPMWQISSCILLDMEARVYWRRIMELSCCEQ